MKKALLVVCILCTGLVINAQLISNVDFTSIKKKLDSLPALYSTLAGRFIASDSTLTPEEIRIVYYGQCFQKDYNPYGDDRENSEKFLKYYKEEKYADALPYIMKIIKAYPYDTRMLFKAIVCNHVTKDMATKEKLMIRYNQLMDVLFKSGDGKTAETAIVVMRVSDEYEIMSSMEVSHTSQSLRGNCDVMTLMENSYGLKEFFFNVNMPLLSMSKWIKEK